MELFKKGLYFLIVLPALGQGQKPDISEVGEDLIQEVKFHVESDIVILSIKNQNTQYKGLSSADITKLDDQWRKETQGGDKPLISAILSNPLSTYLTRIQAHSIGLFSEIFIMDERGLNVGQSNISTDFWQGDEAKFKETFEVGAEALFIDEPEWKEATKTWNSQINFTITDPESNQPIGAATFEVNLTEWMRRKRG